MRIIFDTDEQVALVWMASGERFVPDNQAQQEAADRLLEVRFVTEAALQEYLITPEGERAWRNWLDFAFRDPAEKDCVKLEL